MRRCLLAAAAIVAAPLLIYGFLRLLIWWDCQPQTMGAFAFDGDMQLDIFTHHKPFDQTDLVYEVRSGTRPVCGPVWIGVLGERTPHFSLLNLKVGLLIAVYERECPHVLRVVYDGQTGECWPNVTDVQDERDRTHDRLLARVKNLTGDGDFTLDWYSDELESCK